MMISIDRQAANPDALFARSSVSGAVKEVAHRISASAAKKVPKVSQLSIAQVLRTTPRVFKENSKNVVIKELKRGKTKSGLPGVRAVAKDVFSKPGQRGRSHKCAIVAMDGKPVYTSKSVHFQCDCEAFMYWCEVALNKYGAAAIKFSNGEPPDTRNPQKLPMICKHLIELAYTCKEHKF